MNGRLIAVLGYSDGAAEELHEICSARLRRAEQEAGVDDVVLLSGRARGRRPASEADLMARSWNGRSRRILLDRKARSTLGNAVGVAAAAHALGIREIVLVTSGWHGRRAAALVRAASRGSSSAVTLAVTDERGSLGPRLRELVCWAFVPFAAVALRRR